MNQQSNVGPDNSSGPTVGPLKPLVRLSAISKSFGAQKAVDNVSIEILPGEIHSLIGENGAGKSTLGKILSGSISFDSGVMEVGGREVTYRSPSDALDDQIVTMHQEISLGLERSVLDNVMLGREQGHWGLVSKRRNLERFEELRAMSGFNLEPHAVAGTLSLAAQQEVEILRALARDARLIVMDEPTAALPGAAAEKLHGVVRALRERGTAVVFISHFLDEVLDLSDRITVLRNGQHVRTTASSHSTVDSLVKDMLGRSLEASYPDRVPVAPDAPVVLNATSIRVGGGSEPVEIAVRAGEVLGIFGLVGSGRSELAHALFGASPSSSGCLEIDGEPYKINTPKAALNAGISLLPESRKDQGLFLGLSQRQNASVSAIRDWSQLGWVNRRKETIAVQEMLTAMGVDRVDLDASVDQLSGGNQQKVLFGKCLMRTPRVLILDEPTRGVDVGSRRSIYDRVAELTATGMAVIVISSELDEVVHLSHRLAVMRDGQFVAEFDPESADPDEVLASAFGVISSSYS